ncbi:hypothetical protein M8C13_04445 [Crossiella sp. SN42]|uniref:hypothetical protein n=1 Tax=Crossiella sp. SN42 TaxID=2944808 RepID=UPI00207C3101|nr:hypothetical protein [Crossiella sp. SN42]MCO1575008.1 hypothetical protein [Crossiella sp. SN42]
MGASTLKVDGQPIAKVTSCEMEISKYGPATLAIELALTPKFELNRQLQLIVDHATRAALVALGWTPPDGA